MKTTPSKLKSHFSHLPGKWQRTRLFIGAGLMFSALTSLGQTTAWETADDIHPGAFANGIITDSFDNVFVAGAMDNAAGVSSAVVMKSTDHGTTWDSNPATPLVDEPADTFAASGGVDASFADITAGVVSGVEHLVTAGTAGGGRWLVRRSLNSGQTWVTLDSFHYSRSVVSGGAGSVAIDSTGRIYAGGSVSETSKGKTITRNLIRKLQNGTWGTIETAFYPGSLVCSGNIVFTVTNTTDSWQVRKSSDGGNTWTLVDQYRFDASDWTSAFDMTADIQGNLYVVGPGRRITTTGSGTAATKHYERFWIVRKGTVGGTQWQTVDAFAPDGPVADQGNGQFLAPNAWPWGVTTSPGGDVLVTGVGVVPGSGQRWITRQLSAQTGTWTTTDEYIEPGLVDRQGRKVAADGHSNFYAVGMNHKSGDSSDWIVRRKLAP